MSMFDSRILGPKPPTDADVWWRADDRRYANYDPWAEYEQPQGSHLVLELTPFVVVRETPKGVWARSWLGQSSFILGTATRQLAVPTKALALADLVARKERHVAGCEARLYRAKEHLAAAKAALARETDPC